jgi:uncharacterized protein
MNLDLPTLAKLAKANLPGALFVTVSGSHLYGFSSVDSDIDLRGAYLAPVDAVLGFVHQAETIERKLDHHGVEVELVAHEAAKYLRLLCRDNGYILEQILSPLVLLGDDFLARLRPLAQHCVTRGCYRHYRGFYHTQLKMLEREPRKKAKTLLYAYRVLLTGIHLLRSGEVEANLPRLNERFGLPFIDDLIVRKHSAEFGTLDDLDWERHAAELRRLEAELDAALAASTLPEAAPREELNRFLIDLRRERFS